MGHIHQKVQIAAEKSATVTMFVDTGATWSMIPSSLARLIGIKPLRRRVTLRLADGRRVRLSAGTALFQMNGREAPATVLVGKVDEPILGVETLEGLGLMVDPRRQRLIASRPYAGRLGGYFPQQINWLRTTAPGV